MITTILTILHVIVCFILIVVILIQGGRGQGLSGPSFSSGNVQSLFGTRAADFLTKATSVSAIGFIFTCIFLNIMETRKYRSLFEDTRQTAPVDVDTIKKALEKIAAEQGDKVPATVPAADTAGAVAASKAAVATTDVQNFPATTPQAAPAALPTSAPAEQPAAN